MSTPIPFLWTNDDITVGQSAQLQRQLDFIERHGIRGDFFVIPSFGGKTIDQDADLLRTIERARNAGHGFYQHGFIHTAFESGVPPLWALDFSQSVRREFDERRLEIEAGHSFEALTTMLQSGQRIWRRAFGEDSPGYRPGWGAFCGNLYRACDALGYQWTSSRLALVTCWLWNRGQWDAPIEYCDAARIRPYRIGRLLEFPIAGEYAFTVPHEPARIDAMVELALKDTDHLVSLQAPMLLISHHHGLSFRSDSGYAVHDKLLPRLLKSGKVQPMTMADLVKICQGEGL